MNILLITSCNRIKQTLLSLSLNAQTIKQKFSVVIVDSSTPNEQEDSIINTLHSDDPYNTVNNFNYCSDVNLLETSHQFFPNIEEFKVIHFTPRLTKQRGESTSIALGLMQAAIMGNRQNPREKNFCLKLTGTSILKWDVVSELPSYLSNSDVLTWHRANIGGYERSTRIFGCRPEILSNIIAQRGWYDWCDDNSGVLEQRFAKIIENDLPDRVNYTGNDENGMLLEGGMAMQQSYGRERINNFIKQNNIDTNATPYLRAFMNGELW